jgi:hypothetical protein
MRRHRRERLVGRSNQETRRVTRDRTREQQVCLLQVETRALQGPNGARETRRLDADGGDHVAATAEVRVRDEQAVELRLVAQADPRRCDAVVTGYRDDVPAQLLDHPTRVRDPFTIRRRRRGRPTPAANAATTSTTAVSRSTLLRS